MVFSFQWRLSLFFPDDMRVFRFGYGDGKEVGFRRAEKTDSATLFEKAAHCVEYLSHSIPIQKTYFRQGRTRAARRKMFRKTL